MLDSYIWGDVDRISYEAPIPVLLATNREVRLGGAGSVSTILRALETHPIPVCVVGDDHDGRAIVDVVKQLGMPCDCLMTIPGRSTTVKERFLGRTQSRHPQQIIRVDRECIEPIDAGTESALIERACGQLQDVDVMLVSDYAKGVCTPGLLGRLISEARSAGVKVVVDPGRSVDYRLYAGVACVTPNRSEAGMALGRTIGTLEEGLAAARDLVATFGFDAATVTLDRDGIALAEAEGAPHIFPVRARQVYDITGAGDAVLAALGFALAVGADWPSAVKLANLAGGLEIERLGVAPITRNDLLVEMNSDAPSESSKIVSPDVLLVELERRRSLGQKIVMTNGCFDLLHPGHLTSLQYARSLGHCLVVGMNNDVSVANLKGKGRPIIDEQGRAQMLAALACVDYVVLFEETSVAPLVDRVRPDILVKAAQYTPDEVVGGELVRSYGGRIALAPVVEGLSTTEILERARRLS
ncbi:MAG: bifunctional heptose 7-phosphate kinase/heptose 1-phosphate adenyltransferase [Planctomycetaceae bacterium]|nr:bifunctional heptose 7-phosphate kinase/heptose 1-phosphate adenyltransferase [Planctomycetaceae bacterium]